MATVVYPEALPHLEVRGKVSLQLGDGRLRSDTDRGPAKVRRVSTSVPSKWQFGREDFTLAQLNDFLDFFETDLEGGVLPFEMDNPLGGTADFRFVSTIEAKPLVDDLWSVTVQLEQLP